MNIKIGIFGQQLAASIDYEDRYGEPQNRAVVGEEEVNNIIKTMCDYEHKTLLELIAEKRVFIYKAVNSKFILEDNSHFVRKPVAKKKSTSGMTAPAAATPGMTTPAATRGPRRATRTAATPGSTPAEPTRGPRGAIRTAAPAPTEEDTDEKGKKGKKPFIKRLKAWLLALLVTAGIGTGAYILIKDAKNRSKYNGVILPKPNQETQIDNGNTSLNNGFTTPEDGERYVGFPDYTSEPRYQYLGSIVESEDMETQIQRINDLCYSHQQCDFQNIVVSSDADTIAAISAMRNRVESNYCSREEFENNLIDYIYEGSNVFDGHVVKPFEDLSPYAQNIVLVVSATNLQECPNYSYTTENYTYDMGVLPESLEFMTNYTFRKLVPEHQDEEEKHY